MISFHDTGHDKFEIKKEINCLMTWLLLPLWILDQRFVKLPTQFYWKVLCVSCGVKQLKVAKIQQHIGMLMNNIYESVFCNFIHDKFDSIFKLNQITSLEMVQNAQLHISILILYFCDA